MTDRVSKIPPQLRTRGNLTPEERKSVTHGDFWIPDQEREIYKRALEALNAAGVAYIVAGAYAIYEHTGIYRKTKDLDLFFEPASVVPAARALRDAGFVTRLEDAPLARQGDDGGALRRFDLRHGERRRAHRRRSGSAHSRPGILAATPVRIAPAEELIWHRLFIGERHRHDMSDVVHLILCLGETLDWERLVSRAGPALAAAARAAADVQLRLPRLPQQRPVVGVRNTCSSGPAPTRTGHSRIST